MNIPAVVVPRACLTSPLPPRHEGRYASLHEVKLRNIPEFYKLSDVTILKFDCKILLKENSIIGSFKIRLLHETWSQTNENEIGGKCMC